MLKTESAHCFIYSFDNGESDLNADISIRARYKQIRNTPARECDQCMLQEAVWFVRFR